MGTRQEEEREKEYQRKEREEERKVSLIMVGILLTGW
jgi:hypothetical protein